MRILSVLMGEAYINVALLLKETNDPKAVCPPPISIHFTKYSIDSHTKHQALPITALIKKLTNYNCEPPAAVCRFIKITTYGLSLIKDIPTQFGS